MPTLTKDEAELAQKLTKELASVRSKKFTELVEKSTLSPVKKLEIIQSKSSLDSQAGLFAIAAVGSIILVVGTLFGMFLTVWYIESYEISEVKDSLLLFLFFSAMSILVSWLSISAMVKTVGEINAIEATLKATQKEKEEAPPDPAAEIDSDQPSPAAT